MKDKAFLDTNIIVYSFDKNNTDKKEIAINLISNSLKNESGCISFQVVQEFLNVALRRFNPAFSIEQSQQYLSVVLDPLCEIYPSFDLYRNTLEIKERWKYSFYDSLIITAALYSNCKILYSEDLQHEQKIQDLQILNPFII
ncbi:MAG: PIN domain-containing protein [Calditrichaeota bacterium]|nr:MAG: PIN domain-containing protein [Calditrichota bacterium]MBL1206742.1 PIN domain-containing protein [Calditrichota bacterium]NOG46568.1 PIN domain-containing protein [Calditrichota bacterium]